MSIPLNVITLKQFYIFDSKDNASLDVSSNNTNNNTIDSVSGTDKIYISMVTVINEIGFSFIHTDSTLKNNYIRSGPYDIFELNNELSNRMNELTRALDIVERCNVVTSGIMTGTNMYRVKYYNSSSTNNDSDGNPNFNTDLSACNVFTNNDITYTTSRLTDLSGYIFNSSLYDLNSYKNSMTKYPSFATNSSFAGKYGTTNGQKNIKQMLGDMNNLSQNYLKIVTFFKNNISDMDKYDTGDYRIDNITSIYNNNLNIRQDLDQKVQTILGYKGSYNHELKNYLDSTIYANIMLSILATTLIYFVLVKM